MGKIKLALVTGAGHRLGGAFASHLARRGFGIVLHYYRSREKARALAGELRSTGVPVYVTRADLRSMRQIARLVEFVRSVCLEDGHELALLVNSAAVMTAANLFDLTPEDWDQTLNLNLRAPLFLAQGLVPVFAPGSLIVNLSDSGANKLWTKYPAYVLSKSSIDHLTRLMAKTFAPRLRVNAIAPGLVLPGEAMPEEEWMRLVEKTPAGRPVAVQDLLLALDQLIENPSITGQVLTVDGGYSLV